MIVKDIKDAKTLGSNIEKIMSNGILVWAEDAYYTKELKAAAKEIELPYSRNEAGIYIIYQGDTVQVPNTIPGHSAVNVIWRSSNTNVVASNMYVVGTSRQNCYLIATLTMQGTSLEKEVSFFCRIK